MKTKFDLTIIVVNFNTAQLTVGCIQSIFDSKPKLSYEVIVVDNASFDNSVALLNKHFKNRIKIVKNEANLGFAKANNLAIRQAKAGHILLLNSDTKVTKGALDLMLERALDLSDVGAVVPRLLNSDLTIQPSIFNFPTIGRAIAQYWLKRNKDLDKFYPSGDAVVSVEAAVMAAFLITPNCLEKVGLLDEKYFMYFEDLDYCQRVKKAGLLVWYEPSAKVIHYHGQSGKSMEIEGQEWKRLIPSSKLYHGLFKHYLFNFVLWIGQKRFFTK